MRFWGRVVAVLAVAGCSGSVPNADHITGQNVPILASSVASDEAPPIVFNTQMRSDIEVPACASESKGHAQIKILQDGTIESTVILDKRVTKASASGISTICPRGRARVQSSGGYRARSVWTCT